MILLQHPLIAEETLRKAGMERSPGHFCNVIVNIINERDFDWHGEEAQQLRNHHVSPDWSGKLNCRAWAISFEEQNEVWRQMTIDFPNVYFELLGVDCKINEKDRTADVIMRTAMIQGNVRLMTACELKWKFSNGRWLWYHHCGMRGIWETL